MSTPPYKPKKEAISVAKKYFQNLELDKALAAITLSVKESQQNSGSDLSTYENIFWCEVLLAKGRFLNDRSYATLALNKLSEVQSLLPQLDTSIAFLPLQLLLAKANLQLNKLEEAEQLLAEILATSQKEASLIGEIEAFHGLSTLAFKRKNHSKALELANQALELLIQETNEEYNIALAENHALLSHIYLYQSDFSQAQNYGERLLKISQTHDLKELNIQADLLLGKVFVKQQDYIAAITHLLAAADKSKQIGHLNFLAQALLYKGVVYNQVFHYPKALENLQLVETKYLNHLDTLSQLTLNNYLGKSHFFSYNDELAQGYFEKVIRLAKSKNTKEALALSFAYMGRIYARKNNLESALIYAKRANDIIEKTDDIDGAQVNLINLGRIHSQLEKYSESIKLASRGIAAAKRMKDGFYEIQGYQIMAEIFRKKKDYKSAVMYQMIYTKFYEDFYQRNDRLKVCEVEHQFVVNQLTKQIDKLTNQ